MAGIVSMNMTRFALLALGIGAGIFVAAVIAGTAFFATHHRSERASGPQAEEEFQRLRARFPGQQPLLDMHDRRATANALPAHAPIRSVHTMIFDTRGGERLVNISVPYRFARLFKGGSGFSYLGELTFLDDTEFDPEPIQLSLDQIERHGPGLLVDYRRPGGGQFIAWAE